MNSRRIDKNTAIGGAIWKFLEQISAQLVSFIVSIILARLLSPEEYGAVTALLIFITVANVFVTSGISDALIQKKDATRLDFSSMFWVALGLSIILYVGLFFAAPYLADLYKTPSLTSLLRVLSLRIPINAFSNIQHAYVSKHMMFRKFFYSSLIGTTISGVVGIGLAYMGFGPWSLVFQYLTLTTIDTIVLLIIIDWKPRMEFSFDNVKKMSSFSIVMMFSALINTLYGELQSFVIGVKYKMTDLSFYKKGFSFPQLVITSIDTAISSALFPVIAENSDDVVRVKTIQKKAVKVSTYCIFPIMFGMAAVSRDLISVLLTEKWIEASYYLVQGCLFYAMQPIQTTTWQALKALGKQKTCIRCEIIKKIIGIAILFGTIPFGVRWVTMGIVLSGVSSCAINMIAYKETTDYSVLKQLNDIIPNLILSVIMLVGVMAIRFIPGLSKMARLIIQVMTGIVVYIVLSRLTHNESFEVLGSAAIEKIKSKK